MTTPTSPVAEALAPIAKALAHAARVVDDTLLPAALDLFGTGQTFLFEVGLMPEPGARWTLAAASRSTRREYRVALDAVTPDLSETFALALLELEGATLPEPDALALARAELATHGVARAAAVLRGHARQVAA